jgi:DHA1 family quinolone resistance protein-like MFS transporter
MNNTRLIRWLTCLMFMMFAMTSDAVGSIIPMLIRDFKLNMTAAGAFHYVPMTAIALGALLLGFLADRFGRKNTIVGGLILYGVSCLLFAFSDSFGVFVGLLALSGLGVAIFKTGALALVGDISPSSQQHTSTMNLVEGFFAVGAIIGPALVAWLSGAGLSWKYLYLVAAGLCAVLTVLAARADYPAAAKTNTRTASVSHSMRLLRDPYAAGFSLLIMLYVAVEVAIYVWMPTYLQSYSGSSGWLVAYALSLFFVLRAVGRFLGVWLLRRWPWQAVLAIFGAAIFLCFAGSLLLGVETAAWLLPVSGLFMSVMYPTLNSKGISCFPVDEHGSVAGIILFFTALAAALGPLAMAALSDVYGDPRYGFLLACGFAALLSAGLVYLAWRDPTRERLAAIDLQASVRPAA